MELRRYILTLLQMRIWRQLPPEYVTKAEFNQALAQLESMIMVPKDQEKKSTALVF